MDFVWQIQRRSYVEVVGSERCKLHRYPVCSVVPNIYGHSNSSSVIYVPSDALFFINSHFLH